MSDYKVGDKVRITELWDGNFGAIGKILRYDQDDDSYLIEFQYDTISGHCARSDWYYGDDKFVLADQPENMKPYIGVDYAYCSHKWKVDYKSIFTNAEYYSCERCGKKKEEV